MAQKLSKKEPSADQSEKIESIKKDMKDKTATTTKKTSPKKKTAKENTSKPIKEAGIEKTIPGSESNEADIDQKMDRGSILLGIGMLVMGGLLLAGKLLQIPFGRFLWPFIFIIPGALVFLSAISSDSSSGEGLSILGGILSALGLVFLMQSVTGFWASWAYIWALIAPTSIGFSQMVYGNLKQRDAIAASGMRLLKIGLTLLVVGFIFFEVILGISGFGLRRFGLPVFPIMLILFGAFMLVRSFLEKR
jgi:hypothetical protein